MFTVTSIACAPHASKLESFRKYSISGSLKVGKTTNDHEAGGYVSERSMTSLDNQQFFHDHEATIIGKEWAPKVFPTVTGRYTGTADQLEMCEKGREHDGSLQRWKDDAVNGHENTLSLWGKAARGRWLDSR